jgi:hypothetical protein
MYAATVVGAALIAVARSEQSEAPLGQNPIVTTTSCVWNSPYATSFDLSALRTTTGYTVTDVRIPTTQYWFNVCGNVNPPDVSCSTGRPINANPATAWQMENVNNLPAVPNCYRLGNSSTAGWAFSLIGACSNVLRMYMFVRVITALVSCSLIQIRTTRVRVSILRTVVAIRSGAPGTHLAPWQCSSCATRLRLPRPPRRFPQACL